MTIIADTLWYARMAAALARVVLRPVSYEETVAMVRRRMAARDQRFLALAALHIYGYPQSPYLQLLGHAGCEYGDLETLVRQRGLEPTLESLRRAGVYLSYEEFKGKVPVVRNGRTFHFSEQDFANPFLRAGVETRTGGTRSRGSPVSVGLQFVAESMSLNFHLALAALNLLGQPAVLWSPGVSLLGGSLAFAHIGNPPVRWFAMHDPNDPSLGPRSRRLPRLTALLARGRGIRLPPPEFTPVDTPEPVLAELLSLRDRRGGCFIFTSPSAAVRLAALADRWGATLRGVTFLAGMEPLTPGKAADVQRAGARVGSVYGFTEGGVAGIPCGGAQAPDDMHLAMQDFVLIPHRRPFGEIEELNAFMLTSLAAMPPKVMLNVEIDDFGEVTTRRCGCPLDALGLHQHLTSVRSFTKLTGEGSTILGTDCVRILEEVLPREFGGRSIDYQLLEVEDEQRLTRLLLLVSPDVGPVDERRVLERFIAEVRARTSQGMRMWRQAETIRVVRREPVATPRGKILPFHTQALAAFMVGGSADLAALAAPHPAGRPT